MKHAHVLLGLALCYHVAVSSTFAETKLSGQLAWNNGDALDGQLVKLEDNLLSWVSPRFTSSQRIHVDVIDAISFKPDETDVTNDAQFRVQLSTGDILFGEMRSLTADSLELSSQRFGNISIKRDYLRELRQLRHTEVIYDGPRWLDSWRVLKAGRRLSEWKATEHGHLHTTKYGGEVFHDLPELEVAEINLGLTWTGKPGFQIDFSAPADLVSSRPKPKLSIKSWGNDVVAQSSLNAADFQHLLKLTERQKELRLRIVWDNTAGEIIVTGDAGRELARVLIDNQQKSEGFGVLVKNRSDDLTLEQIRVSKWNGTAHSKDRQPGKSYLRLADGRLVVGTVSGMENGQLRMSSADELVPLDQLAVAEFLPTGQVIPQASHLRFQDGAEISGQLLHVENAVAQLRTPVSAKPITIQLAQLESIRFFQGKTSEYDFHLHFPDGKRLSGNLAPVTNTQRLGWMPVGSQNAVGIADNTATVERRMGQRIDGGTRWGSEIVYFQDGSMVTGDVLSIDDRQLAMQTPYSDLRDVPLQDNVRAVEIIQAAGRVSFASDNWEFLREARPLQRSHERMEISTPVSFRDLNLFHGGKLSFNCSWDRDFVGLITIYLGTSTKLPRGGVARLTISRDHMIARCLLKPAATNALPAITERRASVSLASEGKHLSIWVNGMLAIDTELKTDIAGKGLWIQCGSAKGPLSRTARGDVTNSRLVIDRLRVGDSANRLGARFASSGQLNMLLNLPRNRRDNAPKTILCSVNGDLLRGHLTELAGDAIRFRSNYTEVELPRSDVAALVWVKPLVDSERPAPKHEKTVPPARVTLVDGSTYMFETIGLETPQLVGIHNALQQCRIPIDRILKVEMGYNALADTSASTLDWQMVATPEPKFIDLDGGLDSPFIGFDVEQVVVPMLDGRELTLGSYRDKVIVLDFWATWCAPCIRSLPKLVNLVDSFPDGTVELVAINQEESPFTIKTFTASRDLDVAVGLDPDLKLADQFGVSTIPHTVIIDTAGRVARVYQGSPTGLHEDIAQAITELLPPTD